MAPAPPSDATLPPLIDRLVDRARRLVVSTTAGPHTLTVVACLSARHDLPTRPVTTVGQEVVEQPLTGDLYVHGLPDVFGRLLPAPTDRPCVVVVDLAVGDLVQWAGPVITVGEPQDGRLLAGALRDLFPRLRQQRGVRPVFVPPPPLGLPFIAPSGIDLPGSFGRTDAVAVPGLPDLVVVRPAGSPPPRTSPRNDPPVVVP